MPPDQGGITDLAVEALHVSVTLTAGNSLFAFGIPTVLDGSEPPVFICWTVVVN